METITMTQEELDKKIQESVAKATQDKETELKKDFDNKMAQQRQKASSEKEEAIKKVQEEAKLSAEELAKKQYEEQVAKDKEELESLRHEKKVNDRAKKLAEAGVPNMFVNDIRLLNATDDKVDEVIKQIKTEYDKLIPSGSKVDTNVGGNPTPQNQEQAELERMRKLGRTW